MERLLHIWFLVATAIGGFFGSWLMARAEMEWSVVLALMLIILAMRKRQEKSRKKTAASPPILLVICAACLVGTTIATSKGANDWLNNSLVLLDAMMQPVRHFDGEQGKVALTTNDQSKIATRMAALRIGDHNLQSKMLIAFNPTLALLDGKKLTYLTQTGTALSATTQLSDGSVILYSEKRAVRQQEGIPVLTRAIIRGNQLYRLWERKVPGKYLHHWGDTYDGRIYYPGKLFVDLPRSESRAMGHAYADCVFEDSIKDIIYVFDADTADIVETIDIMPAIIELNLRDDTIAKSIVECDDPLHLNDIQIIKNEREAGYFPGGAVGDLLLSFRDISTIFLMDRETHAIKWYVQGTFSHQHSPRITEWGTILIYDNRGGREPNGRSRIVEVDIATRKEVGIWEAAGNDYFDGWIKGKLYVVGKQIIVEEQEAGKRGERIFTLNCPSLPISNACTKTTVVEGVSYDNAIPLRP